MFQSLLGFLMRCDFTLVVWINKEKFQSLLGFLMRCDSNHKHDKNPFYDVSIPAGFSDALRQQREGITLYAPG